MKKLRNLFSRAARPSNSRFERYYGEVIRSGVGYPTADEARRDMQRQVTTGQLYGWFR